MQNMPDFQGIIDKILKVHLMLFFIDGKYI
jgi:hypothetical protein